MIGVSHAEPIEPETIPTSPVDTGVAHWIDLDLAELFAQYRRRPRQ